MLGWASDFPIETILKNGITIKGSFRYGAGDFKLVLDMAMSEKVDLKPLITKTVPFRDAVEALETTKRGEGIKSLIKLDFDQ